MQFDQSSTTTTSAATPWTSSWSSSGSARKQRRSARTKAETWQRRVTRARERGGFAQEDQGRAARWSTCAVAEQARRHPGAVQFRGGCPADEELGRLGIAFFAAVLARDVGRAETTLSEIERRVRDLERLGERPPPSPLPDLHLTVTDVAIRRSGDQNGSGFGGGARPTVTGMFGSPGESRRPEQRMRPSTLAPVVPNGENRRHRQVLS